MDGTLKPKIMLRRILPRSQAVLGVRDRSAPATEWMPVITLVLWLSVESGALVGWVLAYPSPRLVERTVKPTQAELLSVQLTAEAVPLVETSSAPASEASPPSLPERFVPASAPAPVAVAEPSPAAVLHRVAESPVQATPITMASSSHPAASPTTQGALDHRPLVQQLHYGQGEGKQPAPEYPLSARRQGQQGTVAIRFTVGTDGQVVAAEVAKPAPWATLTEAALRVVRDRWRFRPGPLRLYEVSIRFELSR